jgi:uncharacterized protein with ACT and thioredoxin-like domain
MQSVGESCIGAIDEEKMEEIRGANIIICSMELIGGRSLADAEQHNNQPLNRIEGELIEFVSRFGEQ